MTASTIFNSLLRPGVFLAETQGGSRTPELASFATVYMFGSGATGAFGTPTLCTSLADFTTKFGASASTTAVQLFFRNDRAGGLHFIRTRIAARSLITIDAATAGDLTVVINGVTVTVTVPDSQTVAQVASLLITTIAGSALAGIVTALTGTVAGTVNVFPNDPAVALTVTSADDDVTLSDATPASLPNSTDYIYAIENAFDYDEEWPQGFVLAPEAFANLSVPAQRQAVGVALENLAANKDFDWFAVVDAGPGITTVAALLAEGQLYSTAQGHLGFYGPYVTNLEGVAVPVSAGVVGVATRRYRQEGFQEPFAGAKFPVRGVTDVVTRFSNTEQGVLNPEGVNLVRFLRNKGVVIWGMRTRSANSYYTFAHTRVILNVLNGTLRRAYDFDLFSAIDGQGVLLSRLKETADSVCRRLWRGRALFGSSEEEAFQVICNFENNDAADLENGNVLIEVYVAPVPALEKLLIRTVRVPIGQVQTAAAASTSFTG